MSNLDEMGIKLAAAQAAIPYLRIQSRNQQIIIRAELLRAFTDEELLVALRKALSTAVAKKAKSLGVTIPTMDLSKHSRSKNVGSAMRFVRVHDALIPYYQSMTCAEMADALNEKKIFCRNPSGWTSDAVDAFIKSARRAGYDIPARHAVAERYNAQQKESKTVPRGGGLNESNRIAIEHSASWQKLVAEKIRKHFEAGSLTYQEISEALNAEQFLTYRGARWTKDGLETFCLRKKMGLESLTGKKLGCPKKAA